MFVPLGTEPEDPVSDSDVDSSADPHDVDYSLLTSDHVM